MLGFKLTSSLFGHKHFTESSSEPPSYPFYSLTFSSFWTIHYGLHFHGSISVIFCDFEKCTSLDCIGSCRLTSHFRLPPVGIGSSLTVFMFVHLISDLKYVCHFLPGVTFLLKSLFIHAVLFNAMFLLLVAALKPVLTLALSNSVLKDSAVIFFD